MAAVAVTHIHENGKVEITFQHLFHIPLGLTAVTAAIVNVGAVWEINQKALWKIQRNVHTDRGQMN